jgi:REP element-mobilizing transposase RayT
MAGTFSQLYIQIVFSVKGRQNLIKKEWSEELYKYIAGIIKGKNQKPIIVNGMPDHIHIFVGFYVPLCQLQILSETSKAIPPILSMKRNG